MTGAAEQYGQALYELARDEDISREVFAQMQTLQDAFREEPGFLRLLSSPNLSKQERCDLLDESFRQQLHPYLLNFLKILTQEGLIRRFPDCCAHVRNCYYTDNHILPVKAYTAQPLSQEQTQLLTEKMQTITGETVLLENLIDPDCLGGVRLSYDGKQIDGTVQNRLASVGKLLKNTVL